MIELCFIMFLLFPLPAWCKWPALIVATLNLSYKLAKFLGKFLHFGGGERDNE